MQLVSPRFLRVSVPPWWVLVVALLRCELCG